MILWLFLLRTGCGVDRVPVLKISSKFRDLLIFAKIFPSLVVDHHVVVKVSQADERKDSVEEDLLVVVVRGEVPMINAIRHSFVLCSFHVFVDRHAVEYQVLTIGQFCGQRAIRSSKEACFQHSPFPAAM